MNNQTEQSSQANNTNNKTQQESHKQAQVQEIKNNVKDSHVQRQQSEVDEEIPEHFYDSDIASVNQKDFMSDHEPPKDVVQERKLLFKEKLMHVFKTIIRVGQGIDKPAKYDLIKLKYKQVPKEEIVKKSKAKNSEQKLQTSQQQEIKSENKSQTQQNIVEKVDQTDLDYHPSQRPIQSYPAYYRSQYLEHLDQQQYNLGTKNQQIERLVTSMKRGQTALFEIQHLQTSKKSNIKIKHHTEVHLIQVYDWITVIDLQGDFKLLKKVHQKGEGAFRVSEHDEISLKYEIKIQNQVVSQKKFQKVQLQKQFINNQLTKIIWRVLISMKDQQKVSLQVKSQHFKQYQGQQLYNKLLQKYKEHNEQENQSELLFSIFIQINKVIKVDDVYLDGRLLKKTLTKGVSTAKPESSSYVYYALRFIDNEGNVIKQDKCFDSDWWQDFGKLQELEGIRKNYLDDYQVSKMLKSAIKRMKPAQIAEIQCRDKSLFQFGSDFNQMKELLKFTEIPDRVKLIARIYNFKEANTAFNMELDEKIVESKRKKAIAVKLLQQNNVKKALKRFENIVAYYSSQKINQQAYDEKVSALMNCILCHMKMKNYIPMINLCNQIIERPRHGHQVKDLRIQGPGHAKIEGNLPKNDPQRQGDGQVDPNSSDTRRIATELLQSQKVLDKCLYRKAFALVQTGQCTQALESIDKISTQTNNTEEVNKLREQALKGQEKYQNKSKKMFQNMFG